jgi:hypothetical protein
MRLLPYQSDLWFTHGPGLDTGLAGVGFFSGLEIPMLIRTNFSPLRNVSAMLIVRFLPVHARRFPSPAHSQPRRARRCRYFSSGFVPSGSVITGGADGASPFRIATAPGGSGLSALASSRLTCHICVSVSVSL